MYKWAQSLPGINIQEAVGYLDFLNLLSHARLVFTDLGGVQQEASIRHVPAVTLRENTEWVETLKQGANRLAVTEPESIVGAAIEAYRVERRRSVPFGRGDTANQIVNICKQVLEE